MSTHVPGTFEAERERFVRGFERTYTALLLSITNNNMTRAARLAGVERASFWRICHRAGTLPKRCQDNSAGPPPRPR
jgi:DNA-binding NtrC family response regulator